MFKVPLSRTFNCYNSMNTATKSSTSDNTPSDVKMFYLLVNWIIFVDHSKCQIGPAITMTLNVTDVDTLVC